MNPTEPAAPDASQCPLCGQPNDCQLCTTAAYKGPCWCTAAKIPDELIAKVQPESRNKACICRDCVTQFHRNNRQQAAPLKVLPGDFYFEQGLIVFTAAYHLRRGYCCGSGCRHCPYPTTISAEKLPARVIPE
jgi:hypothetical protein